MTATTPGALRDLLSRFGPLRPQPASYWTGEGVLPPDLARFYAEVGPEGEAGALWIPAFASASSCSRAASRLYWR